MFGLLRSRSGNFSTSCKRMGLSRYPSTLNRPLYTVWQGRSALSLYSLRSMDRRIVNSTISPLRVSTICNQHPSCSPVMPVHRWFTLRARSPDGPSLYEQIGGSLSIKTLVNKLYHKLLQSSDPRTEVFVSAGKGQTEEEQAEKVLYEEFLSAVFKDRPFKEIKGMKTPAFVTSDSVGDLELRAFAEILRSVLEELEVDANVQLRAMLAFEIVYFRMLGRERPNKTLYDRLGGDSTLNLSVNILYNKIMQDPNISHWFMNMDIKKQKEKMVTFLRYTMGGADSYNRRDLETAHAELVEKGLNDDDYDIVMRHLYDTFETIGIEEHLIQETMVLLENLRDGVLCKDWWF